MRKNPLKRHPLRLGFPVFARRCACWLIVALSSLSGTIGQEDIPGSSPSALRMPVNLDPNLRFELEAALSGKDYDKAEQLLINEIERDSTVPRYELLVYLGGLFFVDQKYLNAAVAFKKAEALAPLDSGNRFTLAMSYVLLGRGDWARDEIANLAESEPQEPIYRYWLGRLDFDDSEYLSAIRHLEKTLEIDPTYTRAYDRLGLCYQALDRTDEALDHYRKGVLLNREQSSKSPWPPLNLGVLLLQLSRPGEAEVSLREAVLIDNRFAQAHYRLGLALEELDRFEESVASLRKASELEPGFPDPLWALARVLRRTGDLEGARRAIERFQELKRDQEDTDLPGRSSRKGE